MESSRHGQGKNKSPSLQTDSLILFDLNLPGLFRVKDIKTSHQPSGTSESHYPEKVPVDVWEPSVRAHCTHSKSIGAPLGKAPHIYSTSHIHKWPKSSSDVTTIRYHYVTIFKAAAHMNPLSHNLNTCHMLHPKTEQNKLWYNSQTQSMICSSFIVPL